ncbi:MAG TPA: DUF58 domain-containing protein [Acidimicrobiia bacterium]|nr:DUF58 domain-containing protein [Acidimicrobiia bacterium]
MPTLRGWAFSGAGLALVVLWYALGDVELLLAAIFLLIAQAIALILVRARHTRLEVHRRLGSATVHDGDTTTVTLVIENQTRRAVSNIAIEDDVNQLGVATFEVARLRKGESTTATYRVTCRPRGVYRVGPTMVSASDPLGLAEERFPAGPIDRIVVYPALEELNGFPIVRGQDPAMQASRPEHSRRGGEDFYTLREYQRGDDLRRVHWPSSAKTDELMIRQLETPWQSRALVLLDVRDASYESPDAFEKAVSGAATIVTHLVSSGFDADLWAGGSEPIDASRYGSVMERLAMVETDPAIDIRAVATHIRQKGGGGALVIISGIADRSLLSVQQLLARDYPTTVLMTVSTTTAQTLVGFHRLGVATVSIEPDQAWAPAWVTAMRTAWTTASVG